MKDKVQGRPDSLRTDTATHAYMAYEPSPTRSAMAFTGTETMPAALHDFQL